MSGVKIAAPGADAPNVTAATDIQSSRPADPSPTAGPVLELIGSAAEIVFLVDPSAKVVYAGQSVNALLGHDPLQIVGHPLSALVHPAHAAPFDGAIAKALSGARLGEAELRWPHYDGSASLAMKVGFSLLGPSDAVTEGLMVRARHAATRDLVTAYQAGDDAKVRELASSSPLVVFLLDSKGRCTWVNPAWTRTLTIARESAAGLGWVGAVDEQDRSGFRTVAAQAHQRRVGWRQQFRTRDVHGASRWIDAAAAPRFAPDGTVAGYVGVMADITAEVRARSEVNKRTTIVESNADYVVMDERGQRLVYDEGGTFTPLVDTPPVPALAMSDSTRPSLGALPGGSQAQYINEIRPAVLSDGVWQAGTRPGDGGEGAAPGHQVEIPSAPGDPASTAASAAAVVSGDLASTAKAAKAAASSAGQPIAWNFDAVETHDGPVAGWQGPSWATAEANPAAAGTLTQAAPEAPAASEQVYVGLVGPSGSVESIAAVSDTVLEPSEYEDIADQLPAVDPITGLANRALFQERIRLAMARMAKDGVSVAVMFPTLHGYPELRAQVGAKTGDDQLFVVAKRLEATIRQVDTAARIGDADFAILGVGWFFPGDVESVAKRFMLRIQEPLPSIGRQVNLPASMGVAMAHADEPIGMILRRAQRARKMAAELGPGRVYVDHGPGREATTA